MKYYKSLFSDNPGLIIDVFHVQDATQKARNWAAGRNAQSFEALLFY